MVDRGKSDYRAESDQNKHTVKLCYVVMQTSVAIKGFFLLPLPCTYSKILLSVASRGLVLTRVTRLTNANERYYFGANLIRCK